MTPAEIAGRLTDKAIEVLRHFADGEEHDQIALARSLGIQPKGRGNFSAAVRRLYDSGFLSIRWTRDAIFFRITELGRRALAARDGGGA